MSRLLGSNAPHAFCGPTWLQATPAHETREMVQILRPDGRVHDELPLGHRDVMGKAYAAPGWSMRKIVRRVAVR